jgi:hypothetical protein
VPGYDHLDGIPHDDHYFAIWTAFQNGVNSQFRLKIQDRSVAAELPGFSPGEEKVIVAARGHLAAVRKIESKIMRFLKKVRKKDPGVGSERLVE